MYYHLQQIKSSGINNTSTPNIVFAYPVNTQANGLGDLSIFLPSVILILINLKINKVKLGNKRNRRSYSCHQCSFQCAKECTFKLCVTWLDRIPG